MHESYYIKTTSEEHVLPKILKKMENETDSAHANRVKDYMVLLSDEQFSAFGYKIDASDPNQQSFLHFYNEM